MAIKISAWGNGLAAILGAGSILLAAMGKSMWPSFLIAAIIALVLSIILRKLKL